jgi:hypothetical protein
MTSHVLVEFIHQKFRATGRRTMLTDAAVAACGLLDSSNVGVIEAIPVC